MNLVSFFNHQTHRLGQSRRILDSVTTIMGTTELDLTQTALEPGNYQLRIVAAYADITLYVPTHVALELHGTHILCEVTFTPELEEQLRWQATDEDHERVRIGLHFQGFCSQLTIAQRSEGDQPLLAPPIDAAVSEQRQSYEGQTQKLDRP
jgi:hypothetical protein